MTELTKEKHQDQEQEQSAAEFGQVMEENNTGQKSLLRFLTCGSVDDGKSTLIGRLLYDSKLKSAPEALSSTMFATKGHA